MGMGGVGGMNGGSSMQNMNMNGGMGMGGNNMNGMGMQNMNAGFMHH